MVKPFCFNAKILDHDRTRNWLVSMKMLRICDAGPQVIAGGDMSEKFPDEAKNQELGISIPGNSDWDSLL